MPKEPITIKVVLDREVKPPNWFANLKCITVKRETVFVGSDARRNIVNIRGAAFAGFLPGGAVDVIVAVFKRPLVVFEPLQVLMIIDVLSEHKTLNHYFCPSCFTNSGAHSNAEVRIDNNSQIFVCKKCEAMWGYDTPHI